jgi:hypothetical protein
MILCRFGITIVDGQIAHGNVIDRGRRPEQAVLIVGNVTSSGSVG